MKTHTPGTAKIYSQTTSIYTLSDTGAAFVGSVRDSELYLSKCSHLGSPVPFIQVTSKQETYFYEFYIAKFVSALMYRVFHC